MSLRWPEQRPGRDQVVSAYRLLLGREPESEAAIEAQLLAATTNSDLRARLMASAEFRAQLDPEAARPMRLDLPPPDIECVAEEAALAALLARVERSWAALGETEPHWSVVTEPRFRAERLEENRAGFEETGQRSAGILVGLLARHGIAPGELPHCLEFGCGVGRVTRALARRFARVTGCDVSAPHLAVAAREAAAPNTAWWRSSIAAPMPPGGWDLWFSTLVLQHNPPPVSRMVLDRAFAGLSPGGVAVFQVVTHVEGYRFRVADYLADAGPGGIEMHALPQAEIFALAAGAGLSVLEVRDDSHVATGRPGQFLSHSFVLRRPA